MGFMDKLKNLFKKKSAPQQKCDCGCQGKKGASGKCYADEFKGDGDVAKALCYAAAKVDDKIKAGKISESAANIYIARLKEIQASGDSDDSKIIQISQVIGGIINA